MKQQTEIEQVPKCRICKHEDREGIEMLGIISCASWNVCTRRINNTFGTNFTVNTVKTHMTEHMLHKTAIEAGVILDGLTNDDHPMISAESMLQTLMIQGMLDLSKGKIRCKTPSELISVLTTLMNVQQRKKQDQMMEEGDVQGYYAAMAAYGEAIKDTVSPSQLGEIVVKANALGAHFNIGNVQVQRPVDDIRMDEIMEVAVKDYKELGHSRTRDELVEAGVIDRITDGLDI